MNRLSRHSTLQIEPTRRCNLDCKICIRPNLNESTASLSLKDFRKVLDSSDLRHVALHGWGEPLLNPELFQMVKYAEFKGVSTELTTNATLLQRNIGKIFGSGLSSIAFGIHDRKHLPVVMPQIREMITRRNREKLSKPRAYVDIVIYRGNQNEIPELIEASAELNVDAVVLHRVFNIYPVRKPRPPGGNGGKKFEAMDRFKAPPEFSDGVHKANTDVGYISIQEEKELFVKAKKLARELKLRLYLPPKPSIPCRAVEYSIFVTCEGKVTPCPYLAEFYVGDALNGGVREVVDWQPYRSFVKNMKEHPVCSKCPLGSTGGNFYS